MKKWKEFWIGDNHEEPCLCFWDHETANEEFGPDDDLIHVIEKAAFTEAQARIERLREALEELCETVDDSLLLDEQLANDWDVLREAVIKAQKTLSNPCDDARLQLSRGF